MGSSKSLTLPGQGKSTWKELRRSDLVHGGSWGAAVKPASTKASHLQADRMVTRGSTRTILCLLAFTWCCEKLRNGDMQRTGLDPLNLTQNPGRLQVTRGAAQLPCVSWWASLCGLKTLEEFCRSLRMSCSPHYLPWPSKWGAGWEWSLYLGQILMVFSYTEESLPPFSSSSDLSFNSGWELVCHSLLPSSAQGRIICTNRMALFFVFHLTHFFFTPSITSPHLSDAIQWDI